MQLAADLAAAGLERLLDRRPDGHRPLHRAALAAARLAQPAERLTLCPGESPSPNGTATSSAATSETVTWSIIRRTGGHSGSRCDRAYPEIIDEALVAMATTFPPRQPTRRPVRSAASDVLSISHHGVGSAFPQHGPGPKHRRPIELLDWQEELTRANPRALIRGLIHSDGCRVINRFRTRLPSGTVREYAYPRYFFSNLSADIRAIFRRHCALLGIRVTQSNHRNLTVAHRDSVAILDTFVGPKA